MQPPKKSRWRVLLRAASSVFGALLVCGVGLLLMEASRSVGTFGERKATSFRWLVNSCGESLARLSYDLPFIFRGPVPMPKSCIVYMDEKSSRKLGQTGAVWDRSLHTELLKTLAADQPRAILFDVVFAGASKQPEVDDAFAAAIRESGNVFLAGALETDDGIVTQDGMRISTQQVIPPLATLRAAAAGWGVIAFQPLDADYGVRRISPGTEAMPSAAWRAAVKLGASLENTPESWLETRWENYYGPAGTAESIPFDRVIRDDRPVPGFFKDRIVVVGGRSTLGGLEFGKDDFRNPFSMFGGGRFSTGAEVHLTALLNLLNGDWLTRMNGLKEMLFVIGAGIVLGGVLPRFRPLAAGALALVAVGCIGAFACWLSVVHRVWFAWCVPAFVQVPVALVWAVGARYFLEERRRAALRNAFGHYLSPHIADRIADSDFDLSPGGTIAEVSVLFTDLEGFTTLTEELKNPEAMTQVLLKYFEQTSAPIMKHDGMILNFVGDAVTAVWGAPLPERDHARKAALAAWKLHESARIEIDGHKLRTRVGLHTGRVLAGNVGSAERFDYAVVGDPVNFASRLESLNKHFGTNVLISDDLQKLLEGEFIARRLGEFRVVGKRNACAIHEFLGPVTAAGRPAWCDVFEKGVDAFRAGDFDLAERQMLETIRLRDGQDGPAQFYIARIATMKKKPLPEGWAGVVDFTEK